MKFPDSHTHFVDYETIKKDAFMLLNLGYGSFSLRNENKDDVSCRKDSRLFTAFPSLYCSQISTLLTKISVTSRILDDIIRQSSFGIPARDWKFEEMLGDDENGHPLSLRDCFNKVIHAESIDHELMQLPEVYLSGENRRKQWHVRIFILPFCTSVYEWVEENQKAQRATPNP